VQVEQLLELLGVAIGRGTIIAVVHPQDGNAWLDLCAEVQKHGFIRPEVSRDDGPPARLGNGPTDNLQRCLMPQVSIQFHYLIECHRKKFGGLDLSGFHNPACGSSLSPSPLPSPHGSEATQLQPKTPAAVSRSPPPSLSLKRTLFRDFAFFMMLLLLS